jgi:hypothetical protein
MVAVERKKRMEKRSKKIEERAESSLQKKGFLSPVLSPVFHSYSAEFLQQVVSLILLCFAYLFYCPWSVSCWKIQPTEFDIRAWFKEVFLSRNLKRKKRIS